MHTLGSNSCLRAFTRADCATTYGPAGFARHGPGLIEATSVQQLDAFSAGIQLPAPRASFPRRNPTMPSPRPSAKPWLPSEMESRRPSSSAQRHGHFDMQSYIAYQAGQLQNYDYPRGDFQALAGLPVVG